MKSYLLSILLLISGLGYSQSEKDSLQQILNSQLPDTARVNTLNQLVRLYKQQDIHKARQLARQAMELANRIDYNKGFADATLHMGDISRSLNLPEGHEYYEYAISIYLNEGLDEYAAKAYNRAGVYYLVKSDFLQAEINFTKALEILEILQDTLSKAGTLHNLGNVCFMRGKFGSALEYYYQALEISTNLNDKKGISGTFLNIGNVYNKQGHLEKALEHYKKALILKREIGDLGGVTQALNNIGTVLTKQNKQTEALNHFKRAYSVSDSTMNKRGMTEALTNMGQTYAEQGKFNESLENFSKALNMSLNSQNLYAASNIYLSIGKTYTKLGNFSKATEYLYKASETARSISAREEILLAESALADAFEKSGDFKKSLFHFKNFTNYKDTIYSLEILEKSKELELKYDSEESEKQISLLKKENELQDLTISKNRVVTFSSLAVSILILGLLLVILFNYKQNQRTNRILSLQNKDILRQKEEKEILLKEVHHRVKNNLQIINSLLRLQSNYLDDERAVGYFQECQNRVHAMALIHEKIYETQDLSQVSIQIYVETLIENLVRSYGLNTPVTTKVYAGDIVFPVNTLIPIALILNETVSNSLKYAFKNRSTGEITVEINHLGDSINLIIYDNGSGFSDQLWHESPTLGLELVKTFVEQLDGTIVKEDFPGTRYNINFPLNS